MGSLIESIIEWRFDIFETCMIVMKRYLIDIKDLDDRNFRKDDDLKLFICFDYVLT